LHPAELTVCCGLFRFSWHRASRPREILRFSTPSLQEVQKRRGADVGFQAVWAHVSNQEHQVSPRGASDWWRESIRKSVSVHEDKIRGSAIVPGLLEISPRLDRAHSGTAKHQLIPTIVLAELLAYLLPAASLLDMVLLWAKSSLVSE